MCFSSKAVPSKFSQTALPIGAQVFKFLSFLKTSHSNHRSLIVYFVGGKNSPENSVYNSFSVVHHTLQLKNVEMLSYRQFCFMSTYLKPPEGGFSGISKAISHTYM